MDEGISSVPYTTQTYTCMHLLLLIHVHIHTHICTHSFSSIIQVDVLVAVRNADVALDADDVIEMPAKKKARKTIAGISALAATGLHQKVSAQFNC
jgi:hypothetical protein